MNSAFCIKHQTSVAVKLVVKLQLRQFGPSDIRTQNLFCYFIYFEQNANTEIYLRFKPLIGYHGVHYRYSQPGL